MPAVAGDRLDWVPDAEWFGAIVAIHVLIAVPWTLLLGWPCAALAACSVLRYASVLSRRELWSFVFVEDRVVLLEPRSRRARRGGHGAMRRTAPLVAPVWMTDRFVVVRSRRRVIALRAGRVGRRQFARLRRGLLAGARRASRQ